MGKFFESLGLMFKWLMVAVIWAMVLITILILTGEVNI